MTARRNGRRLRQPAGAAYGYAIERRGDEGYDPAYRSPHRRPLPPDGTRPPSARELAARREEDARGRATER